MIYYLLWILVRITLPVYIRKIHIAGKKNLAPNKPIIFACNHPNSFLDALIIATMVSPRYQLHFLVRSDVFRKKWASKVLRAMNQVPVYRRQEGLKNMKRNSETFKEVTDILRKNKCVLIFSEGVSTQNRRLLPLKKGTARMTLEAYTGGVKEVCIIPVGINYSVPTAFRSEVWLNFGKPVQLKELVDDSIQNTADLVNELTAKIQNRLKKKVIHIDSKKQEPEFEKKAKQFLKRNPVYPIPFVKNDSQRFAEVKKIEEQVNNHTKHEKKKKKTNKFLLIILLVATIPAFIGGWVLSAIPFFVSEAITKSKVKLDEFYASVRLGTGMILYIFQITTLVVVLTIAIGWKGLLLLIFAPILCYFSFIWQDAFVIVMRKTS